MKGFAMIELVDADEDGAGEEISRMPRYQDHCSEDVPRLQYSGQCRGRSLVLQGEEQSDLINSH